MLHHYNGTEISENSQQFKVQSESLVDFDLLVVIDITVRLHDDSKSNKFY